VAPILIATGNPGKMRELRAILARHGVDAIGLDDLPPPRLPEPAESGRTMAHNAAAKAIEYARMTERACIADDSGLEVDALGGAPGADSAHYATGGINTGRPRIERDRLNNEALLAALADVPRERRSARFVCVMALAAPPGPLADALASAASRLRAAPALAGIDASGPAGVRLLATTRGEVEGRIGLPGSPETGGVPRGTGGFGYDPLFLVAPDFRRTSAELSPAGKNAISHRGRAASAMAAVLHAALPHP
jgi:XTP/dITP diphosphohydrolase